MTPGVTVRAPGKINLHLGVGAPREDGFHPLVTVYQAVGLCDDVTVERPRGRAIFTIMAISYTRPAGAPTGREEAT